MALDFPNSPSVNDSFSAGGKTWVYNGTKWVLLSVSLNQTVADGAITAAKLASDSVTSAKIVADSITSAKIAAGAVGTTDLAANAVTQAKLAANVSGITITTTANRDTDITSPFTGQFCFLTDTSVLQRYTGSAWIVAIATAPAAPTALSGTALSTTSVSIAFTPGADNGATITNYQYALSTDSGSTYGSFLALDPADATSPITISGLSASTTYTIKIKAVNTMGAGTESAGVSVTTAILVDYLVIAGAGGGGWDVGGGGGAGGLRSTVTATGGGGSLETALTLSPATNYEVTVGAGGAGSSTVNINGSGGASSVFNNITSHGGGGGGSYNNTATTLGTYGSGGGATGYGSSRTGSLGTVGQGFNGGDAVSGYGTAATSGGGGGAGGVGANSTNSGTSFASGGTGVSSSISGSSVTYATGGKGGGDAWTGQTASTANSGNGGDGAGATSAALGTTNIGTAGGSGVVILRYSNTRTITLGAGLTGTTATVSSNKVTTITAGSGNVSWA